MKDKIIGALIVVVMLAAIGYAVRATTYTPPPDKTANDSFTHTDYNTLKNGLARQINGRMGGSNMTASDPVPYTYIDYDINNDGTVDSGFTSLFTSTFTGWKASAISPTPNLTLSVAAGEGILADGHSVWFTSSPVVSPQFTAPTGSYNRYDILAWDNTGALYVYKGKESADEEIPVLDRQGIPLALVFMRPGSTQIFDSYNAGQSYIVSDARPIIANPTYRHGRTANALFYEDFNFLNGSFALAEHTTNIKFTNNGSGAGGQSFVSTGATYEKIDCRDHSAKFCAAYGLKSVLIDSGGISFEARARFTGAFGAVAVQPLFNIGLGDLDMSDTVQAGAITNGVYFWSTVDSDGTGAALILASEVASAITLPDDQSDTNGDGTVNDGTPVVDFSAWHIYRFVIRRIPGTTVGYRVTWYFDNSIVGTTTDSLATKLPTTALLAPVWGYAGDTGTEMDVDYVDVEPLDDSLDP